MREHQGMAGVKRHFVKLKVFLRSHFVAVPETLAECPADQPLVASSASPLTHTLSRSRTSPLGRIDPFALPSGTTAVCAQGTAGVDVERTPALDALIGRISLKNSVLGWRERVSSAAVSRGKEVRSASCGEDRFREGDDLRQLPQILGCGGQ
jgi:hypothetical protein